jgi:hypothetical protein
MYQVHTPTRAPALVHSTERHRITLRIIIDHLQLYVLPDNAPTRCVRIIANDHDRIT